jgi:hypothetical protein
MLVFGGARGGTGYFLDGIWQFHFATNIWQYMNPTLTGSPMSAQGGICTGYDSNTGLTFVYDLSNVYSYTLDETIDGRSQVSCRYLVFSIFCPINYMNLSIMISLACAG